MGDAESGSGSGNSSNDSSNSSSSSSNGNNNNNNDNLNNDGGGGGGGAGSTTTLPPIFTSRVTCEPVGAALADHVSTQSGIPVDRLLIVEIWSDKVRIVGE